MLEDYLHSDVTLGLLKYHEQESRILHEDVSKDLLKYTASHPRRQ
jgi:hypothetical protein